MQFYVCLCFNFVSRNRYYWFVSAFFFNQRAILPLIPTLCSQVDIILWKREISNDINIEISKENNSIKLRRKKFCFMWIAIFIWIDDVCFFLCFFPYNRPTECLVSKIYSNIISSRECNEAQRRKPFEWKKKQTNIWVSYQIKSKTKRLLAFACPHLFRLDFEYGEDSYWWAALNLLQKMRKMRA